MPPKRSRKASPVAPSIRSTTTPESTRIRGFEILATLLTPTPDGIDTAILHAITAEDVVQREATDKDTPCAVCLGGLEVGDRARTLPCFHRYHTACIDLWFARHKTCPVCMETIFEK